MFKFWLGESPVQGCTGGVWGAWDGRYQTGKQGNLMILLTKQGKQIVN
ncbi:hypothetical protein GHAL_3047 [Hafnia alvei ATCC 13337]|uniref:Uncharacterized protein n=1 Tax=Hafnia alvei ATCC 13337 TaxID=910996 RepID=A0ABD3ZD71_HAFAL|nr:hypothetical protein GHAL_3047 [Hafnia alvei ATCC 13337]